MTGKLQTLLASLVAVVSGILPNCNPQVAQHEENVRLVRYMEVNARQDGEVRTFSGVARSGVNSRLSFKVAGTIRNLTVDAGDTVKAGDLIAELDQTDYALQLQTAEAALANVVAQADQAASDHERMKRLLEKGAVPERMYDQAETAAVASSAAEDAARKKVELLRQQLSYTRLFAPADGYITYVAAEVNENIAAGYPVAVLSSGGRPEIQLSIPEGVVPHVKTGDKVSVRFAALEAPGNFSGTVSEVSMSPAPGISTYPVTVQLEEGGDQIFAGMTAEVSFRIAPEDPAPRIIVPVCAVGEDAAGRRHVYVLDEIRPGLAVARKRSVTTGRLTAEGLEISEGLQEGEHIVTAGVARIDDGREVRVDPLEMRACS